MLRYALHHGAITTNPTDRVDFSASRATGDHARFEHRPLTAQEVGALSAALAGKVPGLPVYPAYALLVEFLAYTGLRAAEVSGLEVGDLVFSLGSRCAVNVRRTKDRKNGEWVTGTLKSNKSRRTVPLPPWLATKLADYLADDHPRANEPTAPLWPSCNNGGGYRAKGQRYAVPLDWSQPLAMGTFYDTILKAALEAVGLPASRPANKDTPATRGRTPPRPPAYIRRAPAIGGYALHAGVEVAGTQHVHSDARHVRRLHTRAGRRRAHHFARAART